MPGDNKFDITKESPFVQACAAGDTKIMGELLEKENKLVDEVATNGSYPLMFSAEQGHQQAVSLLLKHKADVNAVVQEGKNRGITALLYAANHQLWDVVKILLDNGATNLDASPAEGMDRGITALWYAVADQQWDIVKTLLDIGVRNLDASPAEGVNRGITTLWIAAHYQQWDIVKTLLDKGVRNLDATPAEDVNRGKTALWYAAIWQQWDIVKILLDKGATSLDATPAEGSNIRKTALTFAAEKGQAHIISLLLEKGANIDIHLKGAAEIVRQVRKSGTVIDAEYDKSIKLLEAADTLYNVASDSKAKSEKLESVLKILKKAVNGRKKGATALHQAASLGHFAVMDALIAQGADLYLTNAEGLKVSELNDTSSLLKAFIRRDKLRSDVLACEERISEKDNEVKETKDIKEKKETKESKESKDELSSVLQNISNLANELLQLTETLEKTLPQHTSALAFEMATLLEKLLPHVSHELIERAYTLVKPDAKENYNQACAKLLHYSITNPDTSLSKDDLFQHRMQLWFQAGDKVESTFLGRLSSDHFGTEAIPLFTTDTPAQVMFKILMNVTSQKKKIVVQTQTSQNGDEHKTQTKRKVIQEQGYTAPPMDTSGDGGVGAGSSSSVGFTASFSAQKTGGQKRKAPEPSSAVVGNGAGSSTSGTASSGSFSTSQAAAEDGDEKPAKRQKTDVQH